MKHLRDNWERFLFSLVGFLCLVASLRFLYEEKIAFSSAVFAISFFAFFYSNLSRFKRFKGFGFEAELWEDKQREAADLIERLKSVVSIYTREIVLNNVLRGRWGDGGNWEARWALYDELVSQHNALGQKIDFNELKQKMDGIFLFDICSPLSSSIGLAVEKAKGVARDAIAKKFGNPIMDTEGHNREFAKLNSVSYLFNDIFQRSEHHNIAQEVLQKAHEAESALIAGFSINPEFDPDVVNKLRRVSQLHGERPLQITSEIIRLVDNLL